MNNSIGKLQDEYDLVRVNGDTLAIIEVKAKAHGNDLEKFVTKKYPNFPKLFNLYRDYHYYAGVATFVAHDDLIKKRKS